MLNHAWRWIVARTGAVIIGAMLVFGIACILAELVWGSPGDVQSPTFLNRAADFLGAVGTAALGGGISGAVIKIMATEGVFLNAVAAVAYGPEGLERRSDKERAEVWRALTRMIYLPFLRPSDLTGAGDAGRQALASELEQAIAKTFTYEQKFYIRRLNRRLEVCWAEPSHQIIEVTDIQEIVIVPFKNNDPIEWVTESTPDSGLSMNDYSIREVECSIWPEQKNPSVSQETDKSKITTHLLAGSGRYEVNRRRVLKWRLDSDPVLAFLSPYVVRELHVAIDNRADDLIIAFKDNGGRRLFQTVAGEGKHLQPHEYTALKASSLLLPDQGFSLTLVRRQTAPPVPAVDTGSASAVGD
ncbi:MAG: hypothetical protein JWN93_975 [Hyphomicrobiales bacterium]|nr:hypothetical protein [Hyphomicrobiales bacterium]